MIRGCALSGCQNVIARDSDGSFPVSWLCNKHAYSWREYLANYGADRDPAYTLFHWLTSESFHLGYAKGRERDR